MRDTGHNCHIILELIILTFHEKCDMQGNIYLENAVFLVCSVAVNNVYKLAYIGLLES
jgi:hypothetical protein